MKDGFAWLPGASRYRDVALAAALCGLGQLELFGHELYNGQPVWPGPIWFSAVLVAATTLPLSWRRSRPLLAVLVVFGCSTAGSLTVGASEAATTFIVLIVATFSGAAYSRHPVVVAASAVIACIAHGLHDPSSKGLADLTWTYGLVALSLLIGRAVWRRQHRIGSLEQDAASVEERHARQIDAATRAERATIARELHDIVSHAVSVIVIQSQVGSQALPAGELDVAAEALDAIEVSARAAMTELRHLLTLLSAEDEPAAVAPAASLRQVDELIGRCRAAGLTVDADIDPTLEPLSPVADLAAYRVIQEALTNTMRHAPGATASISVRRLGDAVELLAQDDGGSIVARGEPAAGAGAGRGLIGMRERLTLAGGRLVEAGRHGGGFRVRALIPGRPAEAHATEPAL
jgi:signal transduction histidine kinase